MEDTKGCEQHNLQNQSHHIWQCSGCCLQSSGLGVWLPLAVPTGSQVPKKPMCCYEVHQTSTPYWRKAPTSTWDPWPSIPLLELVCSRSCTSHSFPEVFHWVGFPFFSPNGSISVKPCRCIIQGLKARQLLACSQEFTSELVEVCQVQDFLRALESQTL